MKVFSFALTLSATVFTTAASASTESEIRTDFLNYMRGVECEIEYMTFVEEAVPEIGHDFDAVNSVYMSFWDEGVVYENETKDGFIVAEEHCS